MKFNSIDFVARLNIPNYELIHFYSDSHQMHQIIIRRIKNKIQTEETKLFRTLINSVNSEWN